jgi:hypothetical protein
MYKKKEKEIRDEKKEKSVRVCLIEGESERKRESTLP